jgi:hypothetical protein
LLAKELDFAKDALYWGASYLERCHTNQDELYALVGNTTQETTEWWGRPEDINFPRPAYAITPANPGSILAELKFDQSKNTNVSLNYP